MSIKVTIEHPSGAFKRVLEISRVDGSPRPERANPETAEAAASRVEEYTVLLANDWRNVGRGVFSHRYGDDLLTLVHEAIDALGGRGGSELRR